LNCNIKKVQRVAVFWVCPLGKEYPSAVWTLRDLIPGAPIGLGNLRKALIPQFTAAPVRVTKPSL